MARRGMPSMVALLGLLAVAGYQNRDKLAEMLKGSGAASRYRDPASGGESGGLLSGLGDLLDGFRQSGQGRTADSWVEVGPNEGLTPDQVERAVGAENIAELSTRTGLSREELLERLATRIPEGVDGLTPNGRMPSEEEAARFLHVSDRP